MVFTNAVVAIFVELSPVVGVTDVGVPVNSGELIYESEKHKLPGIDKEVE